MADNCSEAASCEDLEASPVAIGSDDGCETSSSGSSSSSSDSAKAKKRGKQEKKGMKHNKKQMKKLKKKAKKLKKLAKKEKKVAKKEKKAAKKDKKKEKLKILAAMSVANSLHPNATQARKPTAFLESMLAKKMPRISANDCPPSMLGQMPDVPQPKGLGIDKWGKPVKPHINGVAQGKLEVFRCKGCGTDCSGEASFLQHVQGKKHRAKCGIGFAGLLPNDMGVIPVLSDYAQHMLGRKAAALAAVQASSPEMQELQAQDVDVDFQKIATAVQRLQLMRRTSRSRSRSRSSRRLKMHRHREVKRFVPKSIDIEVQQHVRSRRCLPMQEYRAQLLKLVDDHQVVILEGETGCGKTTQAPQYLLEEAARLSRPCRILCTQPRRLAAIGVATRVAEERGPADGELGATVGYAVRGENKQSDSTCLLFCTTGVALRRLQTDPQLADITHVVVDEVHERSLESDLLLLLLRQLCTKRNDLRLLLMSATIDSDLFANYFGADTVTLSVPGRLFPVETYFLENALELTRHEVDARAEWAKGGGPAWKEKGEPTDPDTLEDIDDCALKERYGGFNTSVHRALQNIEPDVLNVDLVVQLVTSDSRALRGCGKAVLIFVSGVKEIEQVIDAILAKPAFTSGDARRWVLPLHGGLPYEDQAIVFRQPPPHVRKIVVSTNVAETSVTIDDVGLVIDTGRMKENRYDGVRMMASLDDVVVSQANARQRRGRAGRVGPGVCVHLFTKYRHDELLHNHQLPEVKRTPLEQLVLHVHDSPLANRGAAAVCGLLLEPPNKEAVRGAVQELMGLGALETDGEGGERLTGLGKNLAALPLLPRLGKLIVMGATFGSPQVTDDTLTIAAALSSRSPWLAPRDARHEADASRSKFSRRLAPAEGMQSDHLAIVAAYEEWDGFPHCAKLDFAKVNYLSNRTLQAMQKLKRQLLEHLSTAGLVQAGIHARDAELLGRQDGSDGVMSLLLKHVSKDAPRIDRACRPQVLAGLLCAALCPNVVYGMEPGPKRTKAQGNSIWLGPRAVLHVRDRSSGARMQVQLHRSSVHGGEGRNAGIGSPYLVYNELVKVGDSIRVRDVTPVPALAMILFGSSLEADLEDPGVLSICGWLRLRVPKQACNHLLRVRTGLDQALRQSNVSLQKGSSRRPKDGYFAELFEIVASLL